MCLAQKSPKAYFTFSNDKFNHLGHKLNFQERSHTSSSDMKLHGVGSEWHNRYHRTYPITQVCVCVLPQKALMSTDKCIVTFSLKIASMPHGDFSSKNSSSQVIVKGQTRSHSSVCAIWFPSLKGA